MRYIPQLDGLRGLAILAVLLLHLGLSLQLPGRAVWQYGWIGVDLFFVLSGYLITRILKESSAGVHYYRTSIFAADSESGRCTMCS